MNLQKRGEMYLTFDILEGWDSDGFRFLKVRAFVLLRYIFRNQDALKLRL